MKPKTDAIFSRDPALPGIDVCWVTKTNHHFPDHFHDDLYIIGMILSGQCYCLGQKRQHTASGPGSITLLNPGQIHSGAPAGEMPLNYVTCHINLKAMARMAQELGVRLDGSPEFSATRLEDPRLASILSVLFRTMHSGRESLEKESLMISTLHFIFSRYGLKTTDQNGISLRHQPVVRAREILSEDLDQKISLAQVAASVGLSQYHFLRTFKREIGISPHLFRTLKRIEKAKSLLKTKMPAVQVAMETGFTDQSHFSNTFRRYVGATPGQYVS